MTKIIILQSVGSVFNKEDYCIYPMLDSIRLDCLKQRLAELSGAPCYDESAGVHFKDVDGEWLNSLSRDDANSLKWFLNDEIEEIKRIDNSSNPHTLILVQIDNLKSILSKLEDATLVKCDDCGHKGTEFDDFGSRMFVNVETYSSNFVPNGGFLRCLACDEECDGKRDFIRE